MQSWNLREIELADGTRSPVVLLSQAEVRAVLIGLDPGQELGEHQVHEAAFVVVVDGTATVAAAEGAEPLEAGAGTLLAFEPGERHRVSSVDGTRLLLLFAPWPGEGHYPAPES